MDKRHGFSEEQKELIIKIFGKEDPSWSELKEFTKKEREKTLSVFDDKLKSRWLWGDKKRFLILDRSIYSITAQNSVTILSTLETIDDYQKILTYLLNEIKSATGSTKNVSEALAKLKETTEPKLIAMGRVLAELDKQLTEGKKSKEEQQKLIDEYNKIQKELDEKKASESYRV